MLAAPLHIGLRLRRAWRALTGYQGAGSNNSVWGRGRHLRDLPPDALLALEGPTLRERARFLYRNWSSARAGVNALVDLAISTGIDVQPDTGSERVDRRLHDIWLDWAADCGTDGQPLWELERQLFRSEVLEGDGFWQIVWLADTSRALPIALHPLSREQLSDLPVRAIPTGHRFASGVEYDRLGRTIGYHFADDDPRLGPQSSSALLGAAALGLAGQTPGLTAALGTGLSGSALTRPGVFVPAEQIIHCYEPLHPGQHLGEPWLASVINTMHQEAELVRTELASAKASSAAAFAIVTKAVDGWGLGEAAAAPGEPDSAPTDGRGNTDFQISPGGTFRLDPDEDVKVLSHTRPAQQIAPFRQMLRGDLAAALRIRQADLDKNYSNANYNSLRAAQLDLRRQIEPVQGRIAAQSVCRLWSSMLPVLTVAAGLRLPQERRALRRWQRAHPAPDGFPFVNPVQDIQGAMLAIRSGMSTWRIECGSRGRDDREIHRQLRQELSDPLLAAIFAEQLSSAAGLEPEPEPEPTPADQDRHHVPTA